MGRKMNPFRAFHTLFLGVALSLSCTIIFYSTKIPLLGSVGDGLFAPTHRGTTSDTAEASSFNDLLELFHSMNVTANWTDEDPGHRMVPNFVPRQVFTSPEDVVLATHSDVSKSKLDNLMEQAGRWGGPISVALYIKDKEEISALKEFITNNTLLPQMGIHLMLDLPNELGYPHQILRNFAMDNLGSDFFLALDVDFMPPRKSHETLMALMGKNSDNEIRQEMVKNKRLFVLPAFQIRPKENETIATVDMIPESKTRLLDMVLDEEALGFAMYEFPCGHRATDFVEWFNTTGHHNGTGFYKVDYRINFEPYVAGYRPGIPKYWTQVRGYGYDKVSFFYEVHRAGYLFAVLRDLWVVHLQHPTYWSGVEHERNKKKMRRFWKYLDETYPKTQIEPRIFCFKRGWSSVIKHMRAGYNHSQPTILEPSAGSVM